MITIIIIIIIIIICNYNYLYAFIVHRYLKIIIILCKFIFVNLGQLEFLRLRRKAERELGDIFCVKQFHSVCLNSGPVTFTILEDMVDKYIARRKEELRILMES